MRNLNKWFIVISVMFGILAVGHRQYGYRNPELMSTISSMNHEYCSVVIHKKHVQDKIQLALFLVETCKENAFENIKFATDVRGYPSGLSLSVYLTEKDFEDGNQYMNVRYEMIEYRQNSNIKDNPKNYQLYIDNELIEIENN